MILCENLKFHYPGDLFSFEIDRFELDAAEIVAFVGPSGCGKTTFMNLLAGILLPDDGEIRVGETEVPKLGLSARQQWRREKIGLIPQNFELLDYLTVRENLLVPFWIGQRKGVEFAEVRARAEELAERTGISNLLEKHPHRISQGERQRAALCRGLITSPSLILADEPTGNLDPENQEKIVDLLLEEARRISAAVIMITHEPGLLPRFDRVVDVVALREGGQA